MIFIMLYHSAKSHIYLSFNQSIAIELLNLAYREWTTLQLEFLFLYETVIHQRNRSISALFFFPFTLLKSYNVVFVKILI